MRPTRRRFLCVTGGMAGLLVYPPMPSSLGGEPERSPLRSIQRTTQAMGTSVTITAMHENAATISKAIGSAFDKLATIEAVMSIYRDDSEVSQLNRDRELRNPHPYLRFVVERSMEFSRQTGGAFDVTVQPLWLAYQSAQRDGRIPTEDEISAARSTVGWERVVIESDRIRLEGDGTKITLNGIAQGFASDMVLATLKQHQIENALVDAGELAPLGASHDAAWRAGIQHPRRDDAYAALASLEGRCLATSGDYATRFSDDFRHHHLFVPQTGASPEELSSVSIVAPNALQADALSTAVFVLGPEKGMQMARRCEKVDVLMITKQGNSFATPGFPFADA